MLPDEHLSEWSMHRQDDYGLFRCFNFSFQQNHPIQIRIMDSRVYKFSAHTGMFYYLEYMRTNICCKRVS